MLPDKKVHINSCAKPAGEPISKCVDPNNASLFSSSLLTILSAIPQLTERFVHYPRCQKNIAIWYWKRRIVCYGPIESTDQGINPRFRVELPREKSPDIPSPIRGELPRLPEWRNELVEIALVVLRYADQCLVLVVGDQ